MSLAKKCDRCRDYYEQKNISFKKERVNGIALIDRKVSNEAHFNRIVYDLCPKCLNSLVIWLEGESKEDEDD